jgi:flavin reductase (DIM6/NTAB) family NADH-FMN oxidoreductase RutF
MFVPVLLSKCLRLINHGPVVMVTSGDGRRANAAPVQWNMPVNDDPPLVAVALEAGNFTCRLVLQSKKFVVNVPSRNQVETVKACGATSGHKVNKVQSVPLRLEPGTKVKTPHLADALGYLECRVHRVHPYGGVTLVVGSVAHAAADDRWFKDNRWAGVPPTLHHLGGGNFGTMAAV